MKEKGQPICVITLIKTECGGPQIGNPHSWVPKGQENIKEGMHWLLTIQTQIEEVAVGKIVLHDGHEGGHLTEQKHSVIGGLQLGQDTVQ